MGGARGAVAGTPLALPAAGSRPSQCWSAPEVAARIVPRVTTEATHEALQIAVFAGDAVAVYALTAGAALTVGRADDNDVCLDDPAMSRRHAIIHAGPPPTIEDLGAPTPRTSPARRIAGTGARRWRCAASRESAALAVGDRINFGAAVAVVRREPPPQGPASSTGDDDVVIRDPEMRRVYEQAARAAQGLLSVLVLGETGVGKDVLARAIHRASPQRRGRSWPSTAPRSPSRSSRASSSATRRARSPARSSPAWAVLNPPTEARSSSTRSAISR